MVSLAFSIQYTNVTDRQTDGRTPVDSVSEDRATVNWLTGSVKRLTSDVIVDCIRFLKIRKLSNFFH